MVEDDEEDAATACTNVADDTGMPVDEMVTAAVEEGALVAGEDVSRS